MSSVKVIKPDDLPLEEDIAEIRLVGIDSEGKFVTLSDPIDPEDLVGKSAYQLAVDNGFEGSEADWLASLKGDKGDTGPQGPQGPPGNSGGDGPPGIITYLYFNGGTDVNDPNLDEADYAEIVTATDTHVVDIINGKVDNVDVNTECDISVTGDHYAGEGLVVVHYGVGCEEGLFDELSSNEAMEDIIFYKGGVEVGRFSTGMTSIGNFEVDYEEA